MYSISFRLGNPLRDRFGNFERLETTSHPLPILSPSSPHPLIRPPFQRLKPGRTESILKLYFQGLPTMPRNPSPDCAPVAPLHDLKLRNRAWTIIIRRIMDSDGDDPSNTNSRFAHSHLSKSRCRFTVAARRSEEPRYLPGASRLMAWHCCM